MSLHDELHAQYVAQPKVSHREYDDFLVEEIGRLRQVCANLLESIKHDIVYMKIADNSESQHRWRVAIGELQAVTLVKVAKVPAEKPKLPEGVSVLPKCALCENQGEIRG
jgi:hypothetical protein